MFELLRKMLKRTQNVAFGMSLLLLMNIIAVSSNKITKYLWKNENFENPFFCTYFKASLFTVYLVAIVSWKECTDNKKYSVVDQSTEEDTYFSHHSSLSGSSFIPIRVDTVSSTESDDSSIRCVRFSKMAEVREMSTHEASDAIISRLSYAASLRIHRQKAQHKIARTALIFSILWFLASYMFQLSLQISEESTVVIMSSTVSFFTLILSAAFSSGVDKFTISKLFAVLINIMGVIIMSATDIAELKFSRGSFCSLLSAFFYSSCLVFVKAKNDNENKIDIPLLFGFVGLWNLLLMWPIFFILNLLQIEIFELPSPRQFMVLFFNGFLSTVLTDALWLWGCFLTSSFLATIAVSLQIPLSMLFDIFLIDTPYTISFYFGLIPLLFVIIFVWFLTKYEDADPMLTFMQIIYRKVFKFRPSSTMKISDLEEQHVSLIDNHEN